MAAPVAFATSAQLTEVERMIKSVLNAASTWDGAIADARRFAEVITKSRIYGTIEVIKAIGNNPQHGYWGALAESVAVDHNAFLPAYWGKHGLPQIITGGTSGGLTDEEDYTAGVPCDPDEIDSYRNDPKGFYSFSNTKHDAVDCNGIASPVGGKYSIINNQLKFTGESCFVPMIRMDEALIATKTPVFALPTIVKLAPLWNLKEGDNLVGIASALVAAGQQDLREIGGGSILVSPVSDIMEVQPQL